MTTLTNNQSAQIQDAKGRNVGACAPKVSVGQYENQSYLDTLKCTSDLLGPPFDEAPSSVQQTTSGATTTQVDTKQSLACNANNNSKVSASTSTTTLPGKTDEDDFRVPEPKMKRQPRGRGKKTDNSQDQRPNQARKNRRVPISDLDFTSDEDQSLARRYSDTQIEPSSKQQGS